MEEIKIIESPRGTFSCEIGITVEEWESILKNSNITTQNYKEALLDFYGEPGHKATCKELSLKYYDNAKDAQKYNVWITKFGEAVIKHLNRFKIVEDNGREHFWHVAINPGKILSNNLFEWTLRKELVQAIENLGWHKSCSSGDKKPKIWMVGYNFDNKSQYDRFIKESIWEGRFDESKPQDQEKLKAAKSIKDGDIIILKATSTKGKQHDQSFLRIMGVGIVEGEVEVKKERENRDTSCTCKVNYKSVEKKDFDDSSTGSYRKTIQELNAKHTAINDYVNSILSGNTMTSNKYQEYIELLKANRNLVLTGAPGTGKTFMAQAIADEMNADKAFVQFHPSYDYTDFVEGLRPVDDGTGQINFIRMDGVFKKFCRKAIQNLVDSEKSAETLGKELSWQEKLQQFVDDAIENNTKFHLTNGNEFTITEMVGHVIKTNNEQNQKTTNVVVNADEILELLTKEVELNIVRDIRNYFGRKFGTQPDSYAFVIVKEIRKMKKKVLPITADVVRKKDFVFIIDEINRGEASKIFGELFYAIDPGYRGKKENRVQTQYQNLVPETDVFAKGFYVPENVYILATMNDIDRSVESMDFAMRRRFTWKEVTPAETQDMLDSLDASVAKEAKMRMERLNAAIADADGLGAAYMVGPSYFLKLADHNGNFDKLWTLNIEPLLREYLRGSRKAAEIMKAFKEAYNNTPAQAITASNDVVDND